MTSVIARTAIATVALLCGASPALALDPSVAISQYAHTAWTVRDGFSLGNIYAMAQAPDGYLWFGTEFGLVRFDGVRSAQWQPPAGQQLPDANINSLMVSRDGTLWIGTFAGLVTWRDGTLSRRPDLGAPFVASLFQDSAGTVWVGTLGPPGRLCAIRTGGTECYGDDGRFGRAVWAVQQDPSGTLWAAAESGLWRIEPGSPRRYPTPTELVGLSRLDEGPLVTAVHGAGLLQFVAERLGPYVIRATTPTSRLLSDGDIDANKLLRDRDGGLWIGTVQRGLIRVRAGRADLFARANGLSGDVVLCLFEDSEGSIWVSTTGGLDRFRQRAVATVRVEQGLSSDASHSVLAAADGSVWVAAYDGLNRLRDGEATRFGRAQGLPERSVQSLFEDHQGRIWASTRQGLAVLDGGRFVARGGVRGDVFSITGDSEDNLWISTTASLARVRDGRLVESVPWSMFGHAQQAKMLLATQGGVWLGFWLGGGVSYYKDRQVFESYTATDGLAKGNVASIRLDADGALWVAVQDGGVSRIKDRRMATLTSREGLPCDSVHWTIEDDDRAVWLYTRCGLARITRAVLDAWIADPGRRVEVTLWDAADGVRLRSTAASEFSPPVAKSTDGRLWFVTGEGVQVVDPRHLPINSQPPPVHVERVVADQTLCWDNLTGAAVPHLRLPARVRDVQIDYTALSLVAPEKVRFKYKLENQDDDWREVVNIRHVQYSNLRPGIYRFHVTASNNSGVWNEQGDTLEFSVAPAYYQTGSFRVICAAGAMGLLWTGYLLRVRQLHRRFELALEARVSERTRIARELHDTLLQSFHGLLLRFQTASHLLPDRAAEAKERLDAAISQAANAITEGRDAVQGLREGISQGLDLPQAINTVGQELAASPGGHPPPRFEVTVEGTPRTLHPILRDEVYKITVEAIRNAFRHARATRVDVEVRYAAEQFRLRVQDDGTGFDAASLPNGGREGHYGLSGMRERAAILGGDLTVWSQEGTGTAVELRIPGGTAYLRPRSAWFRTFASRRDA